MSGRSAAGPTSGAVRYGGAEVAGVNRSTGYMTQSDHLLPWRTVAGNIEVPLEIQGASREAMRRKVDAIVALVGLRGFEKSYPSQLSGGMRKRTALARLLAYDPETLLLDEPFAALDAQLRLNMQIELLRLRHDPRYMKLAAELWDLITPNLTASGAQSP